METRIMWAAWAVTPVVAAWAYSAGDTHDHRHTAAVQLARAGMPLNLIQQQLGHANITQTMRYARFHPEYGDVGSYFETVEERLGLRGGEATPHCSPHPASEGASD